LPGLPASAVRSQPSPLFAGEPLSFLMRSWLADHMVLIIWCLRSWLSFLMLNTETKRLGNQTSYMLKFSLKKNLSWLVYGGLEDHDIDCRNLVCRSLIAPPIGVTTSSRDGGRNMYWVYCNNPTRWATASYKMLQVRLWAPWKNIWCRKQSINNVVIGNIE
jgi:hypothetical protein